jgi:2-hydroxy-5-methyl-1-naphthoate 7-hydroxylase
MPAFSARRMAQIEQSITDIVEDMLDDIERNGPVFDAMTQYGAKLVVGALVTTMMGLNEERAQILLDYQRIVPIATAIKPGAPYPPECVRATKRAADLAHEVIAERRAGLCSDFLSDLIEARDQSDKLDDEELFGMIFGLFGALAATSRSAGGALYTLYTHTDQLEQLIDVGSFSSCPVLVAHHLSASVACGVGVVELVGGHFRPSTNPQGAGCRSKRITRPPADWML